MKAGKLWFYCKSNPDVVFSALLMVATHLALIILGGWNVPLGVAHVLLLTACFIVVRKESLDVEGRPFLMKLFSPVVGPLLILMCIAYQKNKAKV